MAESRSILVYFNKFQKKTGNPITISVGRKKVNTGNLHFENISGDVIFNPNSDWSVSAPLVIPIIPEKIIPVTVDEKKKLQKALKERDRYRKNHPIVKGFRKDV